MPSDLQWGYDVHPCSVEDVVDEAEWHAQERWAIEDALIYARIEQQPSRAAFAAFTDDFMAFFERMLLANLHEPLNICTQEPKSEDATEQGSLGEFA